MGTIIYPTDLRESGRNNIESAHLVILRMLKILKLICDKHNIDFWLEYGTLLGAIRHKGFIPWDVEADVGILRHDFDKLKEVILSELPGDIFFQTKDSDPDYLTGSYYVEAKLRDKFSNYPDFSRANPGCKWHNGIQVDFFVYDMIILDGVPCFMNSFERFLTGGKSFFAIEEIENLISCQFEDERFYAPIGYDPYLTRNYKNYLELPPLQKRKAEPVDAFNPCEHKEVLYWNGQFYNRPI